MRTFPSFQSTFVLVVCGLALVMAVSGCSSFRRSWRQAVSTPPPANDISGAWEGSWRSDVNGHHGRLRCIVTRLDAGRYRARYKATYWTIMRFSYTVDMLAEPSSGNTVQIRGEADLGWWGGGVYHYAGQASPTNFFSTYNSKYDHGIFQMARPQLSETSGGVGGLK